MPLGRVVGLFGVSGWVKVYSDTAPADGIFDYGFWELGQADSWQRLRVIAGRRQGKGLVAHLADPEDDQPIGDRDAAARLVGADIAVFRSDMPDPDPETFYWTDLVGLHVSDAQGASLGTVHSLMDTGSHAVLVVRGEREYLIPFVTGHSVVSVDLAAGTIIVDPDCIV